MSSLRIRGVENISGQIEISGNKNAVLPMIAAACLCDEPLILHNVPDILSAQYAATGQSSRRRNPTRGRQPAYLR